MVRPDWIKLADVIARTRRVDFIRISNMVIIRIQGGLGNQLFQYALYETFRKKGIMAKVDISEYEEGRENLNL